MIDDPWHVREQAELLKELVESFLDSRPWTLQQRKDVRILAGLLCDHSRAAEMADHMNALERKLQDDAAP